MCGCHISSYRYMTKLFWFVLIGNVGGLIKIVGSWSGGEMPAIGLGMRRGGRASCIDGAGRQGLWLEPGMPWQRGRRAPIG